MTANSLTLNSLILISYALQTVENTGFYTLLARPKKTWRLVLFSMLAANLLISLIHVFLINRFIPSNIAIPIKMTSVFLIYYLTLTFSSAESKLNRWKLVGLHFLISLVAEAFAGLIFLERNIDIRWEQPYARQSLAVYISQAVFTILFYGFTMIVVTGRIHLTRQIRRLLLGITTFTTLAHLMLMISYFYINRTAMNENILLVGFAVAGSLILANSLTYALLFAMYRLTERKAELELINHQVTSQYQYYKLEAEQAENFRQFKHDLANQLQAAQILYQSACPSTESALQMVQELGARLDEVAETYFPQSPVINAVLTSKIKTAKSSDCNLALEIKPDSLAGIAEIDLCGVIANLLDNAIEACLLNPMEQREIQFKMGSKGDYWIIQCTNHLAKPVQINAQGLINTSKSDPTVHGLGLKSIRSTAYRYQGDLQLELTDSQFKATVLLKK